MEPEARQLMAETFDKNMIDKDEYPQTAEIELRCVNMLARLWNAPESEFDAALANWVGVQPGVCIFSKTCGNALALEHNGDLYSCDHFVEPDYKLGNIQETHAIELIASERQRQFGQAKLDTLPQYCRNCEVRFACHGGCPKNRFIQTPDGEPGLNYLCVGYKAFFTHIDKPMQMMVDLLRQGRYADEVMQLLSKQERRARKPTGFGRSHYTSSSEAISSKPNHNSNVSSTCFNCSEFN